MAWGLLPTHKIQYHFVLMYLTKMHIFLMANISTSYYDDFQPTLAIEQWVSKAETYYNFDNLIICRMDSGRKVSSNTK